MKQLNYYQTIEKMEISENKSELFLFLCNISVENLGLILRSAQIFGVKKVIYCGGKINNEQKIKKISRNAIVPLEYQEYSFIDKLKNDGFKIYALEITDTAQSVRNIKFDKKTCIVVGNEQYGIPQEVLDKCDSAYYIEMIRQNISSLNLAMATSIVLYKYLESIL